MVHLNTYSLESNFTDQASNPGIKIVIPGILNLNYKFWLATSTTDLSKISSTSSSTGVAPTSANSATCTPAASTCSKISLPAHLTSADIGSWLATTQSSKISLPAHLTSSDTGSWLASTHSSGKQQNLNQWLSQPTSSSSSSSSPSMISSDLRQWLVSDLARPETSIPKHDSKLSASLDDWRCTSNTNSDLQSWRIDESIVDPIEAIRLGLEKTRLSWRNGGLSTTTFTTSSQPIVEPCVETESNLEDDRNSFKSWLVQEKDLSENSCSWDLGSEVGSIITLNLEDMDLEELEKDEEGMVVNDNEVSVNGDLDKWLLR